MSRLNDLFAQLKSPHVMYRTRAAKELGDLADPAAGPALIAALADESHLVRDNAAFALGALRGRDGRDALEPLTKAADDPHPWVRKSAAKALGMLGDPKALPTLIGALADGESMVRKSAARSLGQIGHASAVPALEKALKDSSALVKEAAAKALEALRKKT